jgi:hypothetical protein
MPSATPRRCGGTAAESSVSVSGMSMAAPTPCTARAPISHPVPVASRRRRTSRGPQRPRLHPPRRRRPRTGPTPLAESLSPLSPLQPQPSPLNPPSVADIPLTAQLATLACMPVQGMAQAWRLRPFMIGPAAEQAVSGRPAACAPAWGKSPSGRRPLAGSRPGGRVPSVIFRRHKRRKEFG